MINATILSVSLAIIAIYISTKLAIHAMTGNLERIRSCSIKKIFDNNGEMPLVDFLAILEKEQNVLLFIPNRSNKPLTISFSIFCVFAAAGIFFPSQLINNLMQNIYLSVYSIIIGTIGYFLWYDFRYYEKFKKLQDKYPVPPGFNLDEINSISVKANQQINSD